MRCVASSALRAVTLGLAFGVAACGARAVPLDEEEAPPVEPDPDPGPGPRPDPQPGPDPGPDPGREEPEPLCPPGVEVPVDEVCGDGLDNDCDGLVDEGCPAPPPGCMCFPGAERYCMTPDYDAVGAQRCSDDGQIWGRCYEVARTPAACGAVDLWYSPAYLACLAEEGHCAQDFWDLDRDLDSWDSIGQCAGIVCEPYRPEGCECVPGARRWCDTPDYDLHGHQECGPSGRWGPCLEVGIGPAGCEGGDTWLSPSLEACMISEGHCVEDLWDLDDDGDTWDSVGDCEEEAC